MQTAQQGRFLKASRVLQLYVDVDEPADRFYNHDEWELPEGAHEKLVREEDTVFPPSELARHGIRIFARFVWSKGRVNPAAPGGSKGRIRQFLTKISFPSKKFGGYRASIMAQLTAWPSGARRREGEKPGLCVRSVDPFELITVHSLCYDRPHGRSWWPANEQTWFITKPYIFWDLADFGLTNKNRAVPRKLGATNLQPHLPPRRNTELFCSLPSFIVSAAQIRGYSKGGGALPPPPADGESSRNQGRASANYSCLATTGEGSIPPQRISRLRAFAREAFGEAYQSFQERKMEAVLQNTTTTSPREE